MQQPVFWECRECGTRNDFDLTTRTGSDCQTCGGEYYGQPGLTECSGCWTAIAWMAERCWKCGEPNHAKAG